MFKRSKWVLIAVIMVFCVVGVGIYLRYADKIADDDIEKVARPQHVEPEQDLDVALEDENLYIPYTEGTKKVQLPTGGYALVNRLSISFHEEATKDDMKRVIWSVNGKIVSGLPGYKAYTIEFDSSSYDELIAIYDMLLKEDVVKTVRFYIIHFGIM